MFLSLMMALVSVIRFSVMSCGDDDDISTTSSNSERKPVITTEGIAVPNPINCQVYHRGDTIYFHYAFEDEVELGSYAIEVHSNHDHHSHSTESNDHEEVECTHDHEEEHEHSEANEATYWNNSWTFDIPAGLKRYEAKEKFAIPDTIAEGDYHFMIRLTNMAGWQQIKALAIIIEE